jgi:hypothetical protein
MGIWKIGGAGVVGEEREEGIILVLLLRIMVLLGEMLGVVQEGI